MIQTIMIWISDFVVEIKAPVMKLLPKHPKPEYLPQMLTQAKCYSQVIYITWTNLLAQTEKKVHITIPQSTLCFIYHFKTATL